MSKTLMQLCASAV